ncbi:hypothetical protein HRK08_12385 [Bordetella pertussis]|nr:hypothetical protein HRK00_06960 [Bordetella pertussis]ULY19209.1 hypothetical protein HRK08_12385 [Bordetella pertussis]ULY26087.1 hypothetical protein HRK06_12400 [Bordetella pertussis]ULY45560.1 hypothetical protein HRK01_07100 [Bordetella pertussis]ULY84675.1 hypothetical protein HRJ88_12370 [Bordetella pertussis]
MTAAIAATAAMAAATGAIDRRSPQINEKPPGWAAFLRHGWVQACSAGTLAAGAAVCPSAGLSLRMASSQRRGALEAFHQPLCGRVCEFRFTIETYSIDSFKDLLARSLGVLAVLVRNLARHRPAFLGRIAANAARADLHAVLIALFLNDGTPDAKIANHSRSHKTASFIEMKGTCCQAIFCRRYGPVYCRYTFIHINLGCSTEITCQKRQICG